MIVAIIQCRLGSKRIPGKVLKKIEGKPMLWHIIERLKPSKHIEKIGIATSESKENDDIINFARKNNILCCAGSEEDLLSRFYQAAKKFEATTIVRIWGDCPFIDFEIVDKVINLHLDKNSDFTSNRKPMSYPVGMSVEVISLSALKKTHLEAKTPPLRHFLTDYIYKQPKVFKVNNLDYDTSLSKIKLTVDYPEDMELTKKIYSSLYSRKKIFLFKDVMNLLNNDKSLLDASIPSK